MRVLSIVILFVFFAHFLSTKNEISRLRSRLKRANKNLEEALQNQTSETRDQGSSGFTCKLYLFAGPHKTGTTTIQSAMKKYQAELSESGFVWPKHPFGLRNFIPLVCALIESWEEIPQTSKFCDNVHHSHSKLITWYQEQFQKSCNEHKHMIVHRENFDLMNIPVVNERLSKNLKRLTPAEDTVVVIVFRSIRWKHLLSAWGQLRRPKYSFKKWVCSLMMDEINGVYDPYVRKVLRVLQLVENYYSRGFRVVLVDYYGSIYHSSLQEVIFIDVMGMSKELPILKWSNKLKHGTKNTNDLSEEGLEMLEAILAQNDCIDANVLENVEIVKKSEEFLWRIEKCNPALSQRLKNKFIHSVCTPHTNHLP